MSAFLKQKKAMTMTPAARSRRGLTFLAVVLGWAALVTGYFLWLRPRIPRGHESLTLAIAWDGFLGETTTPSFPALPVIAALVVAIAVVLLFSSGVRSRTAWTTYPDRLRRALVHFLWVPGLLALGMLIFVIAREYLPAAAQASQEVLAVSLVWKAGPEFTSTQRFGLEGLVGLIVGLLLWRRLGFGR